MNVDLLLSRLRGVKASGLDKWIARCPAHEDKTPSLTIRAMPDGVILLHCFAGCEPLAVIGRVGLKFSDLFPERLHPIGSPKVLSPFSAMDALKCLQAESVVVAIAAADLASGAVLSVEDMQRVTVAAGRIASALEVAHGR